MSLQFEHGSEVRCALVTGASRGVGAEVTRRLAREGYRLTVAARSEAELTEQADRLIAETGTEIHPVAVNLAVQRDVRELVQLHEIRFGRLDLLVLAAGIGNLSHTAGLSTADNDLRFTVGVRSAFLLVGACLPMLRRTAARDVERGCRVIAVAPDPEYGSDHKQALVSLCENLNHAEADTGITATTISPGEVDTGMTMWRKGHVTAEEMLISADVADVVVALTHLTANLVAPNIVVARKANRVLPA
jgi:3-oxoacyl-[acyl-carrier protein] reductase